MKRRNFLHLFPALGLVACGTDERGFHNTDLSAGAITPHGGLVGGDGQPRSFEAFRGQAVIVYFGYTSCPDICPTALRKYASLVRNLRNRDSERVQLLFISLDPERDTPERSDAYAKLFNPGFVGLSGSAQQIAEVARQFNVTYSKKTTEGSPGYVVEHSHGAYVIDPKGRLRLGLAEDAMLEPIVADLQRLLNEK
jgi:protein SCO1/2